MKTLPIVAVLGMLATGSAFAQTAAPAAGATAPCPSAVATADTAQTGAWVPPYGQPVAQKTRAQVYNELVQAEQDGCTDSCTAA